MLTLALIATATASFAQAIPPAQSSNYYLTKSRHQKTAAWIMLGGGVALIGLGFAITAAPTLPNPNDKNTTANVLAVVGLASSLGSIPMFISAAHNKHKAAEMTLNMQKIPMLAAVPSRTAIFQPAFTLKIHL